MTQYCGCLEDVSGNTARYCPQYNGGTIIVLPYVSSKLWQYGLWSFQTGIQN